MTVSPDTWTDEDRSDIVTAIVDGMVSGMTLEDMKRAVWDMMYDDLIFQEWPDLWMHAEQYAPELYEQFSDPANKETSQ